MGLWYPSPLLNWNCWIIYGCCGKFTNPNNAWTTNSAWSKSNSYKLRSFVSVITLSAINYISRVHFSACSYELTRVVPPLHKVMPPSEKEEDQHHHLHCRVLNICIHQLGVKQFTGKCQSQTTKLLIIAPTDHHQTWKGEKGGKQLVRVKLSIVNAIWILFQWPLLIQFLGRSVWGRKINNDLVLLWLAHFKYTWIRPRFTPSRFDILLIPWQKVIHLTFLFSLRAPSKLCAPFIACTLLDCTILVK